MKHSVNIIMSTEAMEFPSVKLTEAVQACKVGEQGKANI